MRLTGASSQDVGASLCRSLRTANRRNVKTFSLNGVVNLKGRFFKTDRGVGQKVSKISDRLVYTGEGTLLAQCRNGASSRSKAEHVISGTRARVLETRVADLCRGEPRPPSATAFRPNLIRPVLRCHIGRGGTGFRRAFLHCVHLLPNIY